MADLASLSSVQTLRPSSAEPLARAADVKAPSKLKVPTDLANKVSTNNLHTFDSFACGHDVSTGATACVSGHASDSVILKGMQLPALAGIRTGIQSGMSLASLPGPGTPSVSAPPAPQSSPASPVAKSVSAGITAAQLDASSSANVKGLIAADQAVATLTVPNNATGKQQVAKMMLQRFSGADFKAAYASYNQAHPGAHITPQKFTQIFTETAWQMSAGSVKQAGQGSGMRTVAIPDEGAVIDLAKLSASSAIQANGGKPIMGMTAAQLADVQTSVLHAVERGVRSDSAIRARESTARGKLIANHVGTGTRSAQETQAALDQQQFASDTDLPDPADTAPSGAMDAQADAAEDRATAAQQENRLFRVGRIDTGNPMAVANDTMKRSADKMLLDARAANRADAESDSVRAATHDDSGVAPGTLAGLSFTGRPRTV